MKEVTTKKLNLVIKKQHMDASDFVRVVEFRNSPKVDDTHTNFELNFPSNDCRDRG